MMDMDTNNIIHGNKIKYGYLPDRPTIEDLKKYSKIKLKKKRSIKKFEKDWSRYVSPKIYAEYMAKVLVQPLLRSLDYQSLGKKLLHVEELPEGAFAKHHKYIYPSLDENGKCARCHGTGCEPEISDEWASQNPADPQPEECRDCVWVRDEERMMGHGY